MKQPRTALENGTRVRTNASLDELGPIVNHAHLDARRPDAAGQITGIVPGSGADLYFVEHAPMTPLAVYCYTEFELDP